MTLHINTDNPEAIRQPHSNSKALPPYNIIWTHALLTPEPMDAGVQGVTS